MKITRWLVLAAVLSGLSGYAADDWHQAGGPLITRWDKDVSPRKVWREYPRPQMARKDWLSLNGLWDYAVTDKKANDSAVWDGQILVPFPIESALSGVMKRLDENHNLIYRRTFKVPGNWDGQRVLLHFGAVDWEAKVFINGNDAGTHRGGYDPVTFDITPWLKPHQVQEIKVVVFDPTEGGQARGKQVREPKGIWYTPSSGIWQTVWLEPVPESSLEDLIVTPDVDNGLVRLTAKVQMGTANENVEAIVYHHGHEVGRTMGAPGSELRIPIPNAELWSPENPFLYDLKVSLLDGKRRGDTVKSYFGMRKISIGPDTNGVMRLMLNNRPYFQMGTLDQGFWPDGLYAPPSDAAMRYDVEMTKKLGFNMIRKHVKVEPDRWYYDCDKLGLLVWQDMPGAYLGNRSSTAKKQFETELRQMIVTHRDHPCIVTWVLFNEGWGEYDTARLTRLIKEIDPNRLVDDASGWTDKKVGDIVDRHHYPPALAPQLETNRACVQGEFGGLGLPVEGHTWTKNFWGYKGMTNRAELTAHYVDLINQVRELKESAGLSAAVYTQISDVETECNGLMTYDREILKPDPADVAAVNRKVCGP